MKKFLSILLASSMLLAVSACGDAAQSDSVSDTSAETAAVTSADTEADAAGEANQNADSDFVWTREGYYSDENNNVVYIFRSEDADNPGWLVGLMTEEIMCGWYIEQDGNTLHGNIVSEYLDEDPLIVTVTEEGDDGIALTADNGREYHLSPMAMEEASITVYINTEGWGQVAYAEDGGTPEFDDEFPSQSAYIGIAEPETYVFAAKPDEGWKFVKWTKDGADYSTDAQITVELTESAEYIAVFWIAGTNEVHVDLDSVTVLGDVLGLPNYGTGGGTGKYVYVFEQDGIIYRAIAESSEEVFNAIFDLDWEDEQYDEKFREILAPLPVIAIENITEQIPAQEELDALVGKTGADLLDDGWMCWGWNLYDMEFYMDHGMFSYTVRFDGSFDEDADIDENDIRPLTVLSVTYSGLGDVTSVE